MPSSPPPETQNLHPARFAGWDIACLGVAAALRLVLLATTRDDVAFRIPYLDSAFYHYWARLLAEGRGDFQGAYFLGPLYPWFLSVLYRLFGPETLVVRTVQAGFGVLGAACVLSIGKRLFGTGAGRAAALLFAFFGPLAFYENVLVMESLLVTLTVVALWVLCVPALPLAARAGIAGLLLGLASLGRPTVLLAAPVVWLALRHWGPPRNSGRRISRDVAIAAAACAVVWAAVILPVLVRNARKGGGPVISTNGGVNFYAGNHAGATGRFHAPPGVQFFTSPVFTSASQTALPPAVAARALTVKAAAGTDAAADSRQWNRRAWEWITGHPLAAVTLFARRVWLVLQAREIPQIESYSFHASRLPALRLFVVDFGWLWTLAALGIWSARRQRRTGAGVVLLYGIALLAPCWFFFVTGRYRLAGMPEVALLAGSGAATLATWSRQREWKRLMIALLVLLPLFVVTHLGARPPRGAAGWEQAQMAERLYALGDLDGAIGYQERAATELPDRPEVHLNLALYWSERKQPGDLQRAEQVLRALVRGGPSNPLFLFNLGVVLEAQGRLGEARDVWQAALAADPGFEPAKSRLLATDPRSRP
jgi:4-amino-4-deoxy-L-arabinose transferase-like glycosyltransferase